MNHPLLLSGFVSLTLGTVMLAASDYRFPRVAELPARPELPDPLVTLAGKKITTAEQWNEQRRPELKALFQHYMYGFLPTPRTGTPRTRYENKAALGGKATLREVVLSFGPPEMPKMHLLVAVPNQRQGPAPCFVGANFCGNHALVNDPMIRIPTGWMYPNYPGVQGNRATEAGRGGQLDVWAIEQSIDRGYAVATFYNGDLDPDRTDVRDGIQKHLRPLGEKHGPHDAATIAIWAWGVQRAVDYLVSDVEIDKKRICVVGHSRLGKTALLAGALDERIALVIPHQAGCGGTGPSRHNNPKAESVKRINTSFPHWFNDTFKEFNEQTEKLPFDQHCLVALCAPRPVLFTNAVEDEWANPDGQFEMLRAADPVYRLLKAGGLEADKRPEPGKLVASTLGYFLRTGKHSMTREDWQIFLDFADQHLGKPKRKEKP